MTYTIKVLWEKKSHELFTDNKYSRAHYWFFDGGVEISASASPQVVPLPMADESAVDPEEAFVASLSSCHMLFFLSIAAANKFTVEKYEDFAEGIMSKNEDGKLAMTVINLKPEVTFSGEPIPTAEQISKFHKLAHDKCYIANSVRSVINIIGS
ncbi:MAG: OsmC family protein [Chitinophagales bacterium]|nr:OsmC family protein [Chitinophagales bacterium]